MFEKMDANVTEAKKTLLSVVVPCYNEDSSLSESHRRLSAVLKKLDELEYEIIYVDDGSQDRTPEILEELQKSDNRVRVIRFSRNFGHQIAVTAGEDEATGDAILIIDADLQDPPEVIPEMIQKWRDGYSVAYGVRVSRTGESTFKRATAKIFYRVINFLSDVPIPLDTGDFRLIDRRIVNVLRKMPERDRFLRGMVSWIGFRQVKVPYERAERYAGETKYPLSKMLRFATDGILSFSIVPLRLATLMGFMASGLAFAGIVYALISRLLTDVWVPGWTALMIAVLFLGGVQLIAMGIIGEYVGRTYSEVKCRPLYIVEKRMGFPHAEIKAASTGLKNSRS